MNRPALTREQIVELCSPFIKTNPDWLKLFYDDAHVYIVGIRGFEHPGKNERGIYDDAMCLIGPNFFETFNGNTDPSKMVPHIATLVPGVYPYHKGIHGITHADGGYPAFRPATENEELPVTRDGETGISKGVAINIHCGGKWGTGSAGCQTIYPTQWLEFQQTAYKLLDEHNQKIIPYILVVWPTT